MKIGFILPANGIAGGIYVVYHHANYLHSIGHDVTIIFVSDAYGLEIKSMQCEVITKKLDDVVNSGISFDVVISTWWETYYEMFQIESAHYLYFCQSDERRFYPSKMSYEVPFVENTYLNKNVGVVTMAKWIADWLQKEYGVQAEYAPNGIDIELFNPYISPLEPKKDKLRLLIEGPGSVMFKRIDMAFKIANRFPDIEVWYISSDGYIKPEWKYDRVFTSVNLYDMPAIYASCDILLKLSSVESFSYPPLEMMACGGTAIVSKFTGHDEYIRHEENALVVEIDDEEGAYAALKRLIENRDFRKMLSQGGIKAANEMNWKKRSPLFAKAIDNLINRKNCLQKSETNNYILVNHLRKLHYAQANFHAQLQQIQQTQNDLQQTQNDLQQTQNDLQQTQNDLQQTQNDLNKVLASKALFVGTLITCIPKKIYLFSKGLIGY